MRPKKFKPWLRQVAVAVVITFSWQQILWAAPDTLSAPTQIKFTSKEPTKHTPFRWLRGAIASLRELREDFFPPRTSSRQNFEQWEEGGRTFVGERYARPSMPQFLESAIPGQDPRLAAGQPTPTPQVTLPEVIDSLLNGPTEENVNHWFGVFQKRFNGISLAKQLVQKVVWMWREEKRILQNGTEIALTPEKKGQLATEAPNLFAIPEVWTEVTRQNNTLWGIATDALQAFHIHPTDPQIDAVVKMIVSDNHITNPDIISVGQRIHIPLQQVIEQFHPSPDLLSQAFRTLTGTPLPQVSQVVAQTATEVSTDGILTQILDWVSSHSFEIGLGVLVVGLVGFLGWSLYQDLKGKKGKGPFFRIQPTFKMPSSSADREPVEILPVPIGTEFSNQLINRSQSGPPEETRQYLEKELPKLDVPDCLAVVEHLLMAFNESRDSFLLELAERVAREARDYASKEEFPVALAYSGLVRHAQGDVESAIQLYGGVIALLPESEKAMETALRYARRDRAIPVFDRLISLATTRRPGTQLSLGDIEEVISGVGEILKNDPEITAQVIQPLMKALTTDPLRLPQIQKGVLTAIGLCLSQDQSPAIIAAVVVSLRNQLQILEEKGGASQKFMEALKRLLVMGEVRLAQQPLMGPEISGEMEALPRLMRGIRPHLSSESALLSAI